MTSAPEIRIAYSPDADDAFMFWAIVQRKIDTRGLRFAWQRADTEALNRGAESTSAPDVSAVSMHQYAYLTDRYLLLPHGGSVGVGYGPVVVAPVAYTREQLEGQKIGVPGLRTTAYLVLRLLIPNFEAVVIPVAPFRRAFNALSSGEVSAALLIHEGRLLYEREGLKLALDIGEAWQQLTGLPLPLGGNVIARSLGPELIAKVSDVLRESIRYALENRDEVLAALVGSETREGVPKEPALFDRYLSMYANQDTLDYGEIGRKAIAELYERAFEGGLIPERVNVEYAP